MIKRVSKTAKKDIEREFSKLYTKYVRAIAYQKAKKLAGKTIEVGKKKILISNRGIKKALSQTIKDNLLWEIKNFIVAHLDDVLNKAKFLKIESPKKAGERVNIQKTLIFEYDKFYIIIWKTKEHYIFHSIRQKNSRQ